MRWVAGDNSQGMGEDRCKEEAMAFIPVISSLIHKTVHIHAGYQYSGGLVKLITCNDIPGRWMDVWTNFNC